MIAAGKMRKRVTVEAPPNPAVRDAYGRPTGAWSTVGTFWAQIRPTSGRELVSGNQVKAEGTHVITMRYTGLIDASMRLRLSGRILNIVQVNNRDEYGKEYQILASEQSKPALT